MEQLHNDSTSPKSDSGQTPDNTLSNYVKSMETEENLQKLAKKLSRGQKSAPKEIPDLSFEKFEQKMHDSGQ